MHLGRFRWASLGFSGLLWPKGEEGQNSRQPKEGGAWVCGGRGGGGWLAACRQRPHVRRDGKHGINCNPRYIEQSTTSTARASFFSPVFFLLAVLCAETAARADYRSPAGTYAAWS